MNEIKITKDNFDAEVSGSDKTVLLDFWAEWCGPCRMVAPILSEIAAERSDVKVCKVNVDEESKLAAAFGVQSIPMLVVVKNGKITAAEVGYRPKEDILSLLEAE